MLIHTYIPDPTTHGLDYNNNNSKNNNRKKACACCKVQVQLIGPVQCRIFLLRLGIVPYRVIDTWQPSEVTKYCEPWEYAMQLPENVPPYRTN